MSEISDTIAATPLLLKPNGAPVFHNVDVLQQAATMRKEEIQNQDGDVERTVKAHSFVVGKKIIN